MIIQAPRAASDGLSRALPTGRSIQPDGRSEVLTQEGVTRW